MKLICLVVCVFLSAFVADAQRLSIQAGYSNFEAFNIGVRHQSKKLLIRYGYGNDFNVFGQGYYNCIFGSLGRHLYKADKNAISLHGKVLVWNIENKSNIFSAVALAPQVEFSRKINDHFTASVCAGYVYSSVFRYKRKSFYEIGWPREWLPEFGMALQYCITCD